MTDRMTDIAKIVIPWRSLVIAATLSLLLGVVLTVGSASRQSAATPVVHAGVSSHSELTSLPSAARGSVSAALGANNSAYAVSASSAGIRAVSPAQHLAVRFDDHSVLLAAGALQARLSLRAVGYGASLYAVGGARVSVTANRVSYARTGLREWYVNGPLGLEQGFTVGPPTGRSAAGPLTLSIVLSGNAHASLTRGGQALTLSGAGGSALRYGGLVARDAGGRTLHSWLELHAGRLLLRVQARGARYPLRIDPLVENGAKLPQPKEAEKEDLLGYSVALSTNGDTALIGAPGANKFRGAAWVFMRDNKGQWTQQGPKLTSGIEEVATCTDEGGGEEACGFGRSVALSADGNTALIGGPRLNDRRGAAWVFTRDGEGKWTQQGPKLTGGAEEVEFGHFGRSVALSAEGNTALIGGSADNSGRGAAWVFTRNGEGKWTKQGSKLTGGEEQGEGHFGGSVALSSDGNTALIGGPGDNEFAGAVWAFARSGTSWSQQGSKLSGGEETGKGHFGVSLALSSDAATGLIGGRNDSTGAGAAWVFTHSGSVWTQQGAKLTGGAEESGQGEFGFGATLSADGNTAFIGAPHDTGSLGAAWIFTRSSSEWKQQGEKITAGEEGGKGSFGADVALADDGTVLIGGPSDTGTESTKIGAAWAFAKPVPPPTVTSLSPNSGPVAGGTTVTITGTGFTGATAVSFGSTGAASFTVNSDTSISAVSSAGTGSVNVVVKAPGGNSAISSADEFTYLLPPPVVKKVSPDEGPVAGGTTVTIAGAGFTGVRAVKFDSTAATIVKVIDKSITVVSPPAQAAGRVDVTVTTPNGTSDIGPGDRYTFLTRPTVTKVSPKEGSVAGGTSVTITGSSFTDSSTVKFGSVAAAAVTVHSDTVITAVSPPAPAGRVDVTVTTSLGTSVISSGDQFSFVASTESPGGTGAGGTGGVLGAGPFSTTCKVSLASARIAVQSRSRAVLKLVATGTGACSGKLTLSVRTKVSHKRSKTRAIASGTFSITPGRIQSVKLKLNATGRSLLRAGHGRLNARLVIVKLSPAPAAAQSASVRLLPQQTKRRAKKK